MALVPIKGRPHRYFDAVRRAVIALTYVYCNGQVPPPVPTRARVEDHAFGMWKDIVRVCAGSRPLSGDEAVIAIADEPLRCNFCDGLICRRPIPEEGDAP